MAPPPLAARRVQSDAEAARELSLEDPSDVSLSSFASARGTRDLLRTAAGGTLAGGRCFVWSFFIAAAVVASFATLAAWQGIAKVFGLTQRDGIEASGVCRIELSGTVGEDGTDMSGWELSAQRWIHSDKRDDASTYASVQNLKEWATAGVWWEVAPHVDEPGAYRIRIRQVDDEDKYGDEVGWYLGASRFYEKDDRGIFSIYASIVSEPTMTLGAEEADEAPAGTAKESSRGDFCCFWAADEQNPCAACESHDEGMDQATCAGASNNVWCEGGKSLIDENRTAPPHGASVASSAWVLVPLNEAGAYNIQLKSGPPGVEEMAGWYLSARRWFKRDRRNEDSTYVSLVRDEEDAATWILTCSSCCVGMDTGTDGEEFPNFYQ